ncbi:hypothetical protein BDV37DRAFT_260147 [Aspergillus pseudonomiae]|uniref:Uncharacterized protein n=1 Tax=Aspergillus pseudonomiae TaxID=1506151 RepID=A0A5N7CZ91_9EURO|nr:uncharacterized protein BDV37DRAFT_260147 [Aspergillus pseudonomiae]KAE8399481.1 hypothetical protein BDV37DRAFT_260147 [Aspergillus pseudonomiae]
MGLHVTCFLQDQRGALPAYDKVRFDKKLNSDRFSLVLFFCLYSIVFLVECQSCYLGMNCLSRHNNECQLRCLPR